MAVSFSPAFIPLGHTVASFNNVFTFGSLTPGLPLLVAFLVIDETFSNLSGTDTLVDEITWSDNFSGIYTANYHLLHVIPDDSAVTFVMTGTASAVGVGAQFPAGSYTLLPPSSSTAVPGESGKFYANPQELDNIAEEEDYLPVWLPSGGGTIFGAFFSHTYDNFPATLDLFNVINGNSEESNNASFVNTPFGEPNDPLWIQVKAFAIETNDDPVEIRVNEATAGEWRWAVALGGSSAGSGWAVGWT